MCIDELGQEYGRYIWEFDEKKPGKYKLVIFTESEEIVLLDGVCFDCCVIYLKRNWAMLMEKYFKKLFGVVDKEIGEPVLIQTIF